MATVLRNAISRSRAVQPLLARRTLATVNQVQPTASSSSSTSRSTSSRSAPLRNACLRQNAAVPPTLTKRWNSSSASSSSASASASDSSSSENASSTPAPEKPAIEAPAEGYKPQKIAQIEPRLQMTFTCTANDCGHRSTHEFSKRAYTKGLVLVQCPDCKSRLVLLNGYCWIVESTEEGTLKTVEDLLAAKGEKIRKGRMNFDGDIEYEGDD
ncbi:hypothetical protein I317_06230 [Kwoniella heveanensis CBS 569]|nr:hypothetical protein I317_06230 [Kwoniella heveanensis CBS 569]